MPSWHADVVSVHTQYTIKFLGFSYSTPEAPRSHHRGTELRGRTFPNPSCFLNASGNSTEPTSGSGSLRRGSVHFEP
jgi:hypothetical protein